MNRKILLLAFIGFSSTSKQSVANANEPNISISQDSDNFNKENEKLIAKAESWFNSDGDLEDYDIYHQDVDRVNEVTRYVHKMFPNLMYQRNQIDSMEKVVILHPGESKLKENQTYVVFRQTLSHPKHYTGHLAYIRKFRGQVSVEWDILRSDVAEPKEVFAAAFTPYTYSIKSVVRPPKDAHEASKQIKPVRRRKRASPKSPTQKPKKGDASKSKKGGSVAKQLKSKIFEGAIKGKPNSQEATTRQSANSAEEPITQKTIEKHGPNAGDLKKEIGNYIRKPLNFVPILQMTRNSEEEEEIPASEEEDPYIPTNEALTTRRPSMESLFRFRRLFSPDYYNYVVRIRRSANNEETESANIKDENTDNDSDNDVKVDRPIAITQNNAPVDNEVNGAQTNFEKQNSQTPDENDPPNDVKTENTDDGNEPHEVSKSTTSTQRPITIPNRVFEDSQETSISIELSIENERISKSRDGRKTLKEGTPFKRKNRYGKGRNLGSFFGGGDLNDTIPEKRLPTNQTYFDQNDNHKEHSNMIVNFDSKTNHPEFEDKSSPFTGLLDCDYENVTLSSGEFFKFTSDMKTQLVRFLLKTLRGQCLSQLNENTLSLFLEDLVTLGNDMKANLHTVNSIYKKKTLNKSQWDKVISAIYFVIYTDAYRHHAELIHNGQMYSRSPDAMKISLSIRTLTTMIIRGVEIVHDMEAHAVKISKSLIACLNERYVHSLKAANLLKSECPDCSEELDINYQDRIQLRALMQFVIFGIDDNFGKKGSEMDHAFIEFYEKRLSSLTGRTPK